MFKNFSISAINFGTEEWLALFIDQIQSSCIYQLLMREKVSFLKRFIQ